MIKKRPTGQGQARSLAVSAWPLRRKVALAIAIPLVVAATLGGLRVSEALTEAANSSSSAQQVTVLRPAVAYLTTAERAMVAAMGTTTTRQAAIELNVRDLQAAAEELERVRAEAPLTAEQGYQVDALLDLSRALRDDSTATLSTGAWQAQLRQLHSSVTQLITSIVNAQLEPEPQLELLAQALSGHFSLSMQQALIATARTGETGSLELFAELGVEGSAIDRLASALGDSERSVATLRTANSERTRAVRTGDNDQGASQANAAYIGLSQQLLDGIDVELAVQSTNARTRALATGIVTLAALLAAILLALLISRLLLKPIRTVREGALTVAREQLPEAVAKIRAGEEPGQIVPIDVTTHEEIGQLARAVDDLHRQAVHLASGEARLRSQFSEMFVTLSRRNTSLVNQQLALIDKLEKDEEDPRRLESLFKLDHLAARMRRTADSLLILADAPTRGGLEDDLTVADVLQAATAGVQDYQRVRLASATPTRISGAAVADVVHLLTELVDNALAYSSPTTVVELDSIATADGVTLEITDAGLGMPDAALSEINDTLRSGGEITPDTARRMGLFVVSRLAQKHGITASLRRNLQSGITATVVLPRSILPDLAPPAVPEPVVAVPEPEVAERRPSAPVSEPELDDVSARINAALGVGLPKRRPEPSPDRPLLPARGAAPTEDAVEEASEPSAEVIPLRPALTQGREPEVPTQEPADELADERVEEPLLAVVEGPVDEPVVAVVEDQVEDEVEDQVAELEDGITADDAVLSAVATAVDEALDGVLEDALNGARDTRDDASENEEDSPIFKELSSAWLSTRKGEEPWRSSEIEEGWDRAEEVSESSQEVTVNAVGLPVRRPGTRLVPGGVSKPAATVAALDPEAIRKRLAAHASGVSRGRTATSPHQPSKEAGPA